MPSSTRSSDRVVLGTRASDPGQPPVQHMIAASSQEVTKPSGTRVAPGLPLNFMDPQVTPGFHQHLWGYRVAPVSQFITPSTRSSNFALDQARSSDQYDDEKVSVSDMLDNGPNPDPVLTRSPSSSPSTSLDSEPSTGSHISSPVVTVLPELNCWEILLLLINSRIRPL